MLPDSRVSGLPSHSHSHPHILASSHPDRHNNDIHTHTPLSHAHRYECQLKFIALRHLSFNTQCLRSAASASVDVAATASAAVAASGFQVLRNRRVAKFPLQCLRSGGGRCVSGQITMVLMYYITSGVYISHAPKKRSS